MDPAFRALACQLPSEQLLAEQVEEANPAAIHQSREILRKAVTEGLQQELMTVYDSNNRSNSPYSPDATSAGRRALKNLALSYISISDDVQYQALAGQQFRGADNMTDRMAALVALNDRDGEERDAALADFYDKYKDDAIVIDKWLSLQATSSRPDTLDQVKKLMDHRIFSIKQPNKVRALISSFCSGNPYRFHAQDGSGYQFLADRILQIDPVNPQIAARLATQLGRWRGYENNLASLMQKELKRILATDNLSPDLFEIATKSLSESTP